jgi:large repetitive protein
MLMLCGVASGCSSGPTAPSSARVTLIGTVYADASGRTIQDVRVAVVDGVNAGRATMTNGAGAYTLTDLLPGTMTLLFTSSGYLDLRRTETIQRDTTLDVRLVRGPEPGVVLSGRVTTMWGEVLGDVGVEAVHDGRVFGGGTTDRSGVYSIPTLPTQDYIVRALKFGYVTPQIPVTLVSNTTLDIRMDRVRVSIVGSVDQMMPCVGPIIDARVEIVDGPDAGAAVTASVSGYSLSNINWGTFTLRASKSGYTPVSVSMNVAAPGSGFPPAPQTVRQDFRLERTSGGCP